MSSKANRDSSARSLQLGRYAKMDADGTLHLPPIERPKLDDPFANSKLLTFRLSRQKEKQLRQIMYVSRTVFTVYKYYRYILF